MLIIQFIIVQILVFSVVIFFLKKILTGDTQSAINRLDLVYQDLLKKQKDLNAKIKAAEKEYADKKQEALQIVEKLKAEAIEKMRVEKDEFFKKAKAEAEEIIAKAQESTQKLAEEIEKEQRNKIIDYTSDLIQKTLSSANLDKLHDAMVEDFLSKGKELDLSNVGLNVDTLIIRGAKPFNEEIRKKVDSIVTGRLGRKLNIEEEVDETLLAGLQLQFGTLILDGCLANSIKEAAIEKKEQPLAEKPKEATEEDKPAEEPAAEGDHG